MTRATPELTEQQRRERARRWVADWDRRHPGRRNDLTRSWRARNRLIVLASYGGRCGCCDERRPEFLTVQFERGAGIKSPFDFLVRSPRRSDVTVLCFNCREARRQPEGCPHERRRARSSKP